MAQETVLISEIIELLEGSLKKTPKMRNYDKINDTLLPGLKKILAEKGDGDVPIEGLMQHIESRYEDIWNFPQNSNPGRFLFCRNRTMD